MTESYRGFYGLRPGKFQIAETVVARLTWGLPDGRRRAAVDHDLAEAAARIS